MQAPPSPASQRLLLERLRIALEPLRVAHGLAPYVVGPGLRLRSLWGRCTIYPRPGRPAEILVRCTVTGDRSSWRASGAIVATLLHEMAHLKYRGHGQRFWALNRRLLDDAARLGIYDPVQDDPHEPARGAEKLAGSAAHEQAAAAVARRRERAAQNRAGARSWQAGEVAVVDLARGRLAGARVRVLSVARARLTVQTERGERFRIAAAILRREGVEYA